MLISTIFDERKCLHACAGGSSRLDDGRKQVCVCISSAKADRRAICFVLVGSEYGVDLWAIQIIAQRELRALPLPLKNTKVNEV